MVQIAEQNTENHTAETSAPPHIAVASATVPAAEISSGLPLPSPQELNLSSTHLTDLTSRARGYVEAASSANTRKAYAADWKHFSAWCRRSDLSPLPPYPQTIGLYITACASGSAVGTPTRGTKANPVSTIERRLASLSWNYAERGLALDRKDRHIATVMSASARAMRNLRFRKRQSWRKTSSP